MKKYFGLITLFIVFISLAACSKDEEITRERLRGTWVWERTTLNGYDVCHRSDESPICHCREVPFFVFHRKEVESYSYKSNSCELEKAVGKYAIVENAVLIEGNSALITVEKKSRFSKTRLIVEERSKLGVTTISYFVKE